MQINSFSHNPKKIIILLLVLFSTAFVFAEEPVKLKQRLSQEAKVYRDLGLEAQVKGNLDEAMAFYQKMLTLPRSAKVVG